MAFDLRDVTRKFGRGEATLHTLRDAARAERVDRQLAEQVLKLIMEWENSGRTNNDHARSELRMRVKALVPAAPTAAAAGQRRRASGNSFYEPGLRGQRRRS